MPKTKFACCFEILILGILTFLGLLTLADSGNAHANEARKERWCWHSCRQIINFEVEIIIIWLSRSSRIKKGE